MKRQGFTLIEILVSLMIFVIVSGAMLAIMAAATRVYEDGERGRMINDEAMAVMALLDKDLSRAVAPRDGGEFYAQVYPQYAGSCLVGWTVHNSSIQSARRTQFVLWRLKPAEGERILQRKIIDSIEDVEAAALDQTWEPSDNVTDGCLHFGAWLIGTSHKASGIIRRSTHPEPDRHWQRVGVSGGFNAYTEPIIAAPYRTDENHTDILETPLAYPSTIRFTLVLGGGQKRGKFGRLLTDLPANANPSDNVEFRIGGAKGVSTLPGSVCRINGELIGYYDYRGNKIFVNRDREQGPVRKYGATNKDQDTNGRGIFRSSLQDHTKGKDVVEFGRLYSLVKQFAP